MNFNRYLPIPILRPISSFNVIRFGLLCIAFYVWLPPTSFVHVYVQCRNCGKHQRWGTRFKLNLKRYRHPNQLKCSTNTHMVPRNLALNIHQGSPKPDNRWVKEYWSNTDLSTKQALRRRRYIKYNNVSQMVSHNLAEMFSKYSHIIRFLKFDWTVLI